jgi:hypothetical protein
MAHQELLKGRASQVDDTDPAGRHDVGAGRLTEQDGALTEEGAAVELGPLLASDADRRLALEDDVEAGPAEPLAEDALAVGVPLLLERVGDRIQLRTGQVGEERKAGGSSIRASLSAIVRPPAGRSVVVVVAQRTDAQREATQEGMGQGGIGVNATEEIP